MWRRRVGCILSRGWAAHRPSGDARTAQEPPLPSLQLPALNQWVNYTPLQIAIYNGHLDVVAALLAADPAAIREVTEQGETTIFLAAAQGHLAITELLVKRWPQGVEQPVGQSTALLVAAERGHTDVVTALVNAVAPTACSDSPSLLHLAAERGHAEVIPMLARQSPESISLRFDGMTPFRVAFERGHVEAVKALLDIKPSDAQELIKGKTFLAAAVERQNVGLATVLAHAWPDGVTTWSSNSLLWHSITPLELAVRLKDMAMVQTLLEALPPLEDAELKTTKYDTCQTVTVAEELGCHDIAFCIIQRRWSVNTPIGWYNSLFFNAIERGDVKVFEHCLPRVPVGATFRDRDERDRTLIYSAARRGQTDIVRLLAAKWPEEVMICCDRNDHDDSDERRCYRCSQRTDMWLPLMAAVHGGHVATVAALLDACPIGVQLSENINIFKAVGYRNVDKMIQLLLKHCNESMERAALEAMLSQSSIVQDTILYGKDPTVTLPILFSYWPEGVEVRLPLTGMTPLMMALEKGHLAAAELLLGTAHVLSTEGETALHCAVRCDRVSMIGRLVRQWPAGVSSKVDGMTPAMFATVNGTIDALRALLDAAPTAIADTGRAGESLLNLAAKKGRAAIVSLLLERAPGGVRQHLERTAPLHIAITHGHTNVVKVLLLACPAAATEMPLLHLAAKMGRDVIVSLLLERAPGGAVKQRLEGTTPLHVAILHGHADVVKALLQACPAAAADVSTDGESPIFMAARLGRTEIAMTLAALPPSPEKQWYQGKSVLHVALENNRRDIVEAVLKRFPAVALNATAAGETPLHLAARVGMTWAVPSFVRLWPESVAMRHHGATPLHTAIERNNVSCVRALLQVCPAARHDLTSDGKTPLFLAARLGYADIIIALTGKRVV